MSQQQQQRRPPVAGGKTRILLIDDSEEVREAVKELLEKTGRYTVDLAFDGEDGLLKFQPGVFGVVLCDRGMPKKRGDEVIPAIKKMDSRQKVIMFCLGADDIPPREKAMIGADRYIDKSRLHVNEELLGALEELCKTKN